MRAETRAIPSKLARAANGFAGIAPGSHKTNLDFFHDLVLLSFLVSRAGTGAPDHERIPTTPLTRIFRTILTVRKTGNPRQPARKPKTLFSLMRVTTR
jgi:hypothetical protein